MDAECRAALFKRVDALNMREKRNVFAEMRMHKKQHNAAELFFPGHGFTAGEFAVAYVIQLPVKSQKQIARQRA